MAEDEAQDHHGSHRDLFWPHENVTQRERVDALIVPTIRTPTLLKTAADIAARLDCPVLSGIEAGHGSANFTIPFGVRARIDAAARRLSFLEPAVAV